MNKKLVVGGGITALMLGIIVGAYFYAKKSIKSIVAAVDDDFNIDIDDQKIEQTNNQEEESKIVKAKLSSWSIEPISIENEIKKQLDEKCEKCPFKQPFGYKNMIDDKWYIDHINTINLFDGDDRK